MATKNMRVQEALLKEIDRMSKEFGVDRKTLLNASMIILKCVMEHGAIKIDVIDEDGDVKSMPVPLVFSK